MILNCNVCKQITDADRWLCESCSEDLFPFYNIADNVLSDMILDDVTPTDSKLSIELLNQYLYLPFDNEIDQDNNPTYFGDPDLHYFNTINVHRNCKYYTDDTFVRETTELKLDSSNISMFHMNICSVPKHLSELKIYLELLGLEFSFIALTETRLNEDKVNLYDLDGYSKVSRYRTERSGGGVSLFIRNGICYNNRDDLSLVNECFECVFIE